MAVLLNSRNSLTDVIQPVNLQNIPAAPAYLDLRDRVISKASDDQFITVGAMQPWPLIARTVIGDPTQWWVIADLSNVVDPFTELGVGDQIRSPSAARLFLSILSPTQTLSGATVFG